MLRKAIKMGGTTIKSFESSEGVHGNFQNELLIHGRKKNEKCKNCSDNSFYKSWWSRNLLLSELPKMAKNSIQNDNFIV